MNAVILVGGFGTRLRPLTFSIPKPLLPVGEKPILQIIIERLVASEITDIILATGYQSELIQAFCGDGRRFGVQVSYVKEETPLGTAGPLALVRDRFEAGDRFILMNGDILTTVDLRALADCNQERGDDLTVGYTQYLYRSPFGVLSLDGAGSVAGIVEKPCQPYVISAGIYCVKTTVFPFVADGTFMTMPELITALVAAGKRVGAYHIKDCWLGLESIEHFEEALKQLGQAPRTPGS